jgi:hypothetical protein
VVVNIDLLFCEIGVVVDSLLAVAIFAYIVEAFLRISRARSSLKELKSSWCVLRHFPLQLQYSPHMRQLLDFSPISVHMSLVDAKSFAVRISERRENFPSCLARCSSTSLVIAVHSGPVRITGWAAFAAAVAALFHAAGVAPPPPPPPPAGVVVARGGVCFCCENWSVTV